MAPKPPLQVCVQVCVQRRQRCQEVTERSFRLQSPIPGQQVTCQADRVMFQNLTLRQEEAEEVEREELLCSTAPEFRNCRLAM
jgi:hypothetical protein